MHPEEVCVIQEVQSGKLRSPFPMPRAVPWVKVSVSLITAFSWEGKLVDDNFKAIRRNLLLGFENTTTLT